MTIIAFLIIPLVLSGLVHHLVVIKYDIWPALAKPIDGGVIWRGKPLFGLSKTWRGVVVMVGLNVLFSLVMGKAWAGVGAITALGYCLAELPTSFLKRQWGVGPSQQAVGMKGAMFYALEQADSITGAVLAANLVLPLTWAQSGLLIIMGTSLHGLIDCGLYLFGYKKNLTKPVLVKKLLGQKD